MMNNNLNKQNIDKSTHSSVSLTETERAQVWQTDNYYDVIVTKYNI